MFNDKVVDVDAELMVTRKWFANREGGGAPLAEIYKSLQKINAHPVVTSSPSLLFGNMRLNDGE